MKFWFAFVVCTCDNTIRYFSNFKARGIDASAQMSASLPSLETATVAVYKSLIMRSRTERCLITAVSYLILKKIRGFDNNSYVLLLRANKFQ